jgi:hypothetical protein
MNTRKPHAKRKYREAIAELRDAYGNGNLALYLGAGVSAGNGLPTWNQLVLATYFTALDGDWKHRWKPYPNYLFALAEWHLSRNPEPPEITAQKIRQLYKNPAEFLNDLHDALYAGFREGLADTFSEPGPEALRNANKTLQAISELCRKTTPARQGLRAIVTYNYDNLIELASQGGKCEFVPAWKSSRPPKSENTRSVFHVHGFIPVNGPRLRPPEVLLNPNEFMSSPNEIIFTEGQYHSASNDPYSWSNLCQIQCMSGSVGLMVGLSLTDRNMRRLLSALKATPLRKPTFAILKRPGLNRPQPKELGQIHQKAMEYFARFARSGRKAAVNRTNEMLAIFDALGAQEEQSQQTTLEDLGITPLWYQDRSEIPGLITAIMTRTKH